MKRIMIHDNHKDRDTIIGDHEPYASQLISYMCIDVTDEELVFIKLKCNVILSDIMAIYHNDIPTYVIPCVYKITRS